MVDRNRDGAHAPLLDLSGVEELRGIDAGAGSVRLGALTTYADVIAAADLVPGLALAARTVAGPQIRSRATLAGALVLADPSADVLAALGAAGGDVEVAGPHGRRTVPAAAFVRGPQDAALDADELVVAVHVPRAAGPVAYAKVGARSAMARAICGVAACVDAATGDARLCHVGVAPRAVVTDVPAGAVPEMAVPGLDDARASAAHRRRLATVLATRVLRRARGELAAWS